ncbi:MAG: NAD(P)-dependent alcohol dehydrogenase [Halobacteriota archaeon]
MPINAFAAPHARAALQRFDYELKTLSPYEVEVKISHCGICHSDIDLIDNDWGSSHYPLVPGHEIIGTVAARGERVDSLRIGQRVGIGWQAGSCLRCEWCRTGFENLCQDKTLTCVRRPGGFADSIHIDSRFTFPIPASLDSRSAAPLLCAGLTVYAPMRRFDVQPYHRVGIVGLGGLGHVAVQFAHAIGCEVVVFSTHPDKEDDAHRFGATHFINSRDAEQMQKAARTLDFILSTVPAQLPWSAYLKTLRPNGRLIIVNRGGADNPSIATVPTSELVAGQKSINGTFTGGRAQMRDMLSFAARHHVEAQTELVRLADVNAAVQRVRNGEARYRIVLQT